METIAAIGRFVLMVLEVMPVGARRYSRTLGRKP